MCIHNYECKLQAKISKIGESDLSEKNKQLILEMANDLVLDNLSKPRIIKYLEILNTFAKRVNKDLDSFGLRQTYERHSVSDITEFTLDPTFVGFERGYKGENNFKKLSEAHPVAKVIGYAAGQKAKR
jgi:hypothetical protein